MVDAAKDRIEHHGAESLRVRHVVEGGQVGQNTFYQHFDSLGECAELAWQQLVTQYIDEAPTEGEAALWRAMRDAAASADRDHILPLLNGPPRATLALILNAFTREGLMLSYHREDT